MFVGFSSDVILEDTLKVTSCHILLAFNSVFHIISDKLEAWKVIHFSIIFFVSVLPFLSVLPLYISLCVSQACVGNTGRPCGYTQYRIAHGRCPVLIRTLGWMERMSHQPYRSFSKIRWQENKGERASHLHCLWSHCQWCARDWLLLQHLRVLQGIYAELHRKKGLY